MRLKLYRGKWAAVGTDERGRVWRRSLRTSDRATAERRFADLRPETPGETVGDAVKAYLAEKKAQGARSYSSMETAWRALRATFESLRPDHIGRDICRDYARRRQAGGVSDGTIIKDLGVLKAAIKWAGKPGFQIEMPPTPTPRERYITRKELQTLLDACALPHIRMFIALAWATAGRHGAILELTWDRIDIQSGVVRLAQAGQERRKGRASVKVSGWALEALREAYEGRECDYVISWGGRPLKTVKRAFAEACANAGLDDVTPHTLRHSSAVAMVQAGIPLYKVSQFLGHTSTKVTERVYARFQPDHFDDVAKALE